MDSVSQAGVRDLADFVVGLDAKALPERAVRFSVDAMIDCLGCILAGTGEDLAPKLRAVVTPTPAGEGAPLIGTGLDASPTDAALYNGTLAHALDFDDITHPAYSHPTAVLLPTILSLARRGRVSGQEAVAAYVIGVEVFGKLGRALNTQHYRRGWHATATLGSIAAAAAGARLLGLDAAATRLALGIGASGASGLRANFGTMTKPLHSGFAARNGVLAALLAAEGFTANEDVIDADFGFAKTFNGGLPIVWEQLHRWGDELEILSEFGLALKPYPSCGATHPSIEAALLLRQDIGGRYDEVESVRVGIPEMAFQPLIYVEPKSPLQGKFSMHYVVAAALADGAVTLQSFTDAKVADPTIAGLLRRVTMEADERVADNSEFGCVLSLTTKDGRSFERSVPLAIGKPDRWFSRAQLESKFKDCAGLVMPAERVGPLFERWLKLPETPAVSALVDELRS